MARGTEYAVWTVRVYMCIYDSTMPTEMDGGASDKVTWRASAIGRSMSKVEARFAQGHSAGMMVG
jgi:hypothetical protein